jgi:hypothetical protein
MLKNAIDIVRKGGDPMCLLYDPGANECIDLQSWVGRIDAPGWMSPQPAKKQAAEVFDSRYEEFEVPLGSKARRIPREP